MRFPVRRNTVLKLDNTRNWVAGMTVKHGFADKLFADQTIVVTGANSGIGLAVVNGFKACGANVVAHGGRRCAPALKKAADVCIAADFKRKDDVGAFIDAVMGSADHVDVLVNNAGTMIGRFPADQVTDEQYRAVIDLNQSSVVLVTRAFIPLLRKAGNAAIVNTTSISARTGGSPGSSIYSASKAFVAAYSKALARELAPEKIRVNAVSPGTILTEFHDRYSSAEKLESTRRSIPLRRLGEPLDCVSAFLFLASHTLAGYITGQTLEVNGGQLIA